MQMLSRLFQIAGWSTLVLAALTAGFAQTGSSNEPLRYLGGVQVAVKGMRDAAYKEAEIMPHMKGRDIKIEADVGVGKGTSTVWTCDLTHRYIDINGSYRS
jgi:glutamate N-acetyltransferase/amino-acid N-acetyltransferase